MEMVSEEDQSMRAARRKSKASKKPFFTFVFCHDFERQPPNQVT